MVKTISEITIIDNDLSLMLHNKKNGASYISNKEHKNISFTDAQANKAFNYPVTISVNSKVFELTEIGQNLNFKDGKIMAFLSTNDVQELAQKTFYEDGQTPIYDFINNKFTVEL
ncbi:hypothetical protein [Flavobacterium hibisci]|uniref:hypothetical protein n=1 Tax=Flavobacterium hibisci TaxID=1914462 RepID=UPI001CC0210C|nr:hypothetical protein [Flavobacterium hibisci]MBZ4043089.1 hypothetical protein [Flavobacterium hibisci]